MTASLLQAVFAPRIALQPLATSQASLATRLGVNASSVWGQVEDAEAGTAVIIAEFGDDHPLLAAMLSLPYRTIRIIKGEPLDTPNNLADYLMASEASAYLKWIVENYHDLPPRMFFINGNSVPKSRPVRAECVCVLVCASV